MELDRRSLIVLGAGALATGCASRESSGAPDPSSTPSSSSGSPSASPSPTASPTATPVLPAVRRWQPSPNDKVPACKVAAVRRVERAGTSEDRAVQVIDAQYGGLLADSASVLVSTESWRRSGDRVVMGGRTFDVRLSRRGSTWRVVAVNPSASGPRASRLSSTARRVLRADRIDLPPAAARDVASGQVSEDVLRAMLTLTSAYRVGVSVVRSGHPLDVFGTDRPSDHPRGRAFDVWSINGRAVVDRSTPERLVTGFMRAAAQAGSYNVGGPYLLGSAPQWFSDDTHHDHVHAGFPA